LVKPHQSTPKRSKSRFFRRPIVAATILTPVLFCAATWAVVQKPKRTAPQLEGLLVAETGEPRDTKKMSPGDLEKRGIELRAALEKTFDKMLRSGKALNRETDISEAVVPYVSAGMTFEEAERILKAAGFSVSPHPDAAREAKNPNRPMGWEAVYAEIPDFSWRVVLGNVSVNVSLYPEAPGNYTNVKAVHAVIFITTL
jgi:hypothetical protein